MWFRAIPHPPEANDNLHISYTTCFSSFIDIIDLQWHESVIDRYPHIYAFFQILSHYGLLQDIDYVPCVTSRTTGYLFHI